MIRIIIIDDEVTALNLLSDCIKALGSDFFVSGCFDSGESALKFLAENECDVLITDIKMPGMSGLELAKNVSALYPKIKIVLASAYQEFEYAKKAIEYGVYLYLEKPINIKELNDALLRINMNQNKKYGSDEHEFIPDEIFTDFMLGRISSDNVFKTDLLSCGVPETLFSRNILLADIKLDSNELSTIQTRGITRIHYVLKNLICDSSKSENVYFAFRRKGRFIFIIHSFFYDNTSDVLENNLRLFFDKLINKVSLKSFNSIYSIKDYLIVNDTDNQDEASAAYGIKGEENLDESDMIAKAKQYIEENYKKDIMRDDVADYVYVSPSYFSRLFKQATGYSFSEYLTIIRIKNAILLLEKGERPTKIYSKVGYNSNKYFSKNFLKQTLYTPAEYQKKILKTGDEYDD